MSVHDFFVNALFAIADAFGLVQYATEIQYTMTYESDGHTYVIRFTRENALEAFRQLGRWAADHRLPFNQRDYTIAADKIREVIADD